MSIGLHWKKSPLAYWTELQFENEVYRWLVAASAADLILTPLQKTIPMFSSILTLSLASCWYLIAPTEFMREAPCNQAEVVSQAIFSEELVLLDRSEGWAKVETVVDHYRGWIRESALCFREEPFCSVCSRAKSVTVNKLAAHLYTTPSIVYGPLLTLPFESRLELIDGMAAASTPWVEVTLPDGRRAFIQRGNVAFDPVAMSLEEMIAFSLECVGLPYTWGGRSSFGYDCSGFVQMLYRQRGVYLPRDAKDQYRWKGFEPVALEALLPGDLLFFGLSEEKISHVGMYLGEDLFIHATAFGEGDNLSYLHVSDLSAPQWDGSGRLAFRAARRCALELHRRGEESGG